MSNITTTRCTGATSLIEAIDKGLHAVKEQCGRPKSILSGFGRPRSGNFLIAIPWTPRAALDLSEFPRNTVFVVGDAVIAEGTSVEDAYKETEELKDKKAHCFGEPYLTESGDFLMIPLWVPPRTA